MEGAEGMRERMNKGWMNGEYGEKDYEAYEHNNTHIHIVPLFLKPSYAFQKRSPQTHCNSLSLYSPPLDPPPLSACFSQTRATHHTFAPCIDGPIDSGPKIKSHMCDTSACKLLLDRIASSPALHAAEVTGKYTDGSVLPRHRPALPTNNA